MLDLGALAELAERFDIAPRFITVSGAHLYGFPSPDSDVDLRGCHQAPLSDVVGLELRGETFQQQVVHRGSEVELVSHEVGKYLRLLVKNNGYILEQIFSPLVVLGDEFLKELRPIARCCITRHHYHHYRGFYETQRQLIEKEQPKRAKPVLYAYRVLLTGIHLLRTGEVEADLRRLLQEFRLPFLDELIQAKVSEQAAPRDLDWPWHAARLEELEAQMAAAYQASRLPDDRDRARVNEFLVALRLEKAGPPGR